MGSPLRAVADLADRPRLRWLGLMSGTSGDGVDAARVVLEERGDEGPHVESISGGVHPYPSALAEELIGALSSRLEIEDATLWHTRLGEAFAKVARVALREFGEVDAIALSGHTICHLPGASDQRATLQVGSPAIVAEQTGKLVVADFRTCDVAAGGEGAPLVPAGDRVLFAEPGREVAVLNLGGIANVTWLPGDGSAPRAADTGPANLVLNHLVRLGTGFRKDFDEGGRLALSGQVHPEFVSRWGDHPFFQGGAPRSTGREEFGEAWVMERGAELESLSLEDRLATAVAWVAESVAHGLHRLGEVERPDRLLVGGGGAHNRALLEALGRHVGVPAEPLDPRQHRVSSDLREAAAFAILGHESIHGRPGSYSSTTGRRGAGPLGAYYLPTG